MFIERPSSKHRRVIGRGLLRLLVGDDLEPDQQAAPAHVADTVVAIA
jgi:hypothetical protein